MNRILIRKGFTALLCLLLVASMGQTALAQTKEKSASTQKGWLGVSIQDITERMEKEMNLKSRDGALVSDVQEKSPAEAAGLKEDDIVIQYAGKDIQDSDDLQKAVAGTKPDTKISIVAVRKGERKTFDVVIGKRPRSESFVAVTPRANEVLAMFGGAGKVQGMSLRQLNDQLGQYFGVTDGDGVLVWEVEKGSPAEKAGVKAGDVIAVVGKKKIREVRDVARAMGIYDDGEKADVEVLRKGNRQTLSIEVSEERDQFGSQFWYDGSDLGHPRSKTFFVPRMKTPHIEIESFQPEMDRLRIEMDQLRDHLQDGGAELREHMKSLRTPRMKVRFVRGI